MSTKLLVFIEREVASLLVFKSILNMNRLGRVQTRRKETACFFVVFRLVDFFVWFVFNILGLLQAFI